MYSRLFGVHFIISPHHSVSAKWHKITLHLFSFHFGGKFAKEIKLFFKNVNTFITDVKRGILTIYVYVTTGLWSQLFICNIEEHPC